MWIWGCSGSRTLQVSFLFPHLCNLCSQRPSFRELLCWIRRNISIMTGRAAQTMVEATSTSLRVRCRNSVKEKLLWYFMQKQKSHNQRVRRQGTPTWSLWVLITSSLHGPASLLQTLHKCLQALTPHLVSQRLQGSKAWIVRTQKQVNEETCLRNN